MRIFGFEVKVERIDNSGWIKTRKQMPEYWRDIEIKYSDGRISHDALYSEGGFFYTSDVSQSLNEDVNLTPDVIAWRYVKE